MSVKRMIDTETFYNDAIYSRFSKTSLSLVDDVVNPAIRYNFYRTTNKKAFIYDNDIVHIFTSNFELNSMFEEKGFFIIKTVYYKNLDLDTIKSIIKTYIGLGYKFNGNNTYIEKLEELEENYTYSTNMRFVYFISEELLEEHNGIIHLENFIITDDLDKIVENHHIEEDINYNFKFFYVDNLSKDKNRELEITDNVKLDIPVLKDSSLTEGLYLKAGDKLHFINEFIGDVGSNIKDTLNNIKVKVVDNVNTVVNDNLNIKKEIRKIAYEKYKDIIDLVKQEIKMENDVELLKLKSSIERSKANAEIEAIREKSYNDRLVAEAKYDNTRVSSAFGFIKDIIKLI